MATYVSQRTTARPAAQRWSIGLCAGAVLCALGVSGCGAGYLWHVTSGQMQLLSRRLPVEEALHDPRLSAEAREKLRLILAVKAFAVAQLGLRDSASYTTFVQVDGPYVSYNLSAAPPDALTPYVWRFPIVGRLPYKGFFDKAYARREQHQLEARGYDTYLRGVHAFSTLGYFSDPILSSMLTLSDFSLINTIIHELVHETVWIKGNVPFNESLANFVGDKGTQAYLAWRFGQDSTALQGYRDLRADAAVFEAYMQSLLARLDTLYAQPLSQAAKLEQRARLFAEARSNYAAVLPRLKMRHYARFFDVQPLNNAVLLSFRRYHQNPAFFEELLARHDGDLRRLLAAVKTLRPEHIPATFHAP